jgi:hypothetical protein
MFSDYSCIYLLFEDGSQLQSLFYPLLPRCDYLSFKDDSQFMGFITDITGVVITFHLRMIHNKELGEDCLQHVVITFHLRMIHNFS